MLEFPKDRLAHLISQIDDTLLHISTPAYAVFDADGTLWNMDMSEHFVQYQEKMNLIPELVESPWKNHLTMHKKDPKLAYLWLAQINAGNPLSTVRKWGKDFLNDYGPIPTFDFQKIIIDHLHKRKVEVFIVTASVKWAVEPAAQLYGIDHDHVIGVQTEVEDGLITEKQHGEITWRQGKVDGLLKRTNGTSPFFAAGNSDGDLPLIESSSHIRLVVSAARPGEHTYEAEQKMLSIAKERNWFSHQLYPQG